MTGVQTCALPICGGKAAGVRSGGDGKSFYHDHCGRLVAVGVFPVRILDPGNINFMFFYFTFPVKTVKMASRAYN